MKEYKDLNDYEVMYMISENDEYANELMYEKYKPMIVKMARERYRTGKKYGLEVDDFIQEGYYGLYSAIKNYNPIKDNSFSTFAYVSIRSKMNNLLSTNASGKNTILNNSISLYRNIDHDSENVLIDYIADKNAVLPDVEVLSLEENSKLKNLIFELPILEGSVLELYYNGFQRSEISKLLGLGLTKTGYIISKLRKLKVEKIDL